jgi:hypothetical protein
MSPRTTVSTGNTTVVISSMYGASSSSTTPAMRTSYRVSASSLVDDERLPAQSDRTSPGTGEP